MRRLFLILAIFLGCTGCASSTATTELITQGLMGLEMAKVARTQSHEIEMKMYKQQLTAAFDAAFDSDVSLVVAGGLKDADGKAVELTADWIVSARKGYSSALGAVSEQMMKSQQVYSTDLDNIAAAGEALKLANELVVMQWNVGGDSSSNF